MLVSRKEARAYEVARLYMGTKTWDLSSPVSTSAVQMLIEGKGGLHVVFSVVGVPYRYYFPECGGEGFPYFD